MADPLCKGRRLLGQSPLIELEEGVHVEDNIGECLRIRRKCDRCRLEGLKVERKFGRCAP